MPKVRVKADFYDSENDLKLMEKDAEMEVSDERAEELIGLGLVEMAEEKTKPTKSKSKKGDAK